MHRLKYLTIALIALIFVLFGLGRSPALAVTPRHYTELTFPPAPEIKVPDYTRFQLPNGLTVYLLEDHELPLVSGSAMIRTGDRFEPANQVGLASLTGTVMRSGGTITHSADLLNQQLEAQAASIETGIDVSVGTASFSALSEDLTDVFDLFVDVLQHPAFPQDKIDLAKTQWRGSIARRNDDPNGIAGREFQKLIYGADSPYARTVEYATLDNISRSDLINFYQTYVQPRNILLGLVGDFDTATMRSLIEEKLGRWQPASAEQKANTTLPPVEQVNRSGVFLVNQPQLTQSYIQMGHIGGLLKNPDYAALSIMNEVLNGLGGRLVNEVRSRQGLAYVVYAYWSAQFDYPGLFVAGGQTRTEATVPFVKAALDEIAKIRTAPIAESELTRAKDSVLNAFIFNFATRAQMLGRIMRYDYYGYPQDFIFKYQKQLEATTIEDIQQAAQKHLQPEQIVTLVVGNEAKINPPLANLSPNSTVQTIDITIPTPKA